MRFFIPVAVYFLGTWISLHAALAAAGPIEGIHYDKKAGTLTVHVREMPLNEILQTVSAESGLKLSIQGDLNRPVTMDLTAVPLDKAIHRLVQPNSSAMIYSKKEDGAVVLTSVKVFDKGGTPSSPSENLPMPRVNGRRNNRFSAYGGADQTSGQFSGSGGGGPANQGGGGGRNNRRNRGQRGAGTAASNSGSQTSGATGATGSQGTTGGSAGGGGSSGR